MSAMIDWLAGMLPASPAATPIRRKTSEAKPVASPQRAVMPLHRPSAIVMRLRRLLRSASRAMGIDSVV